MTDQIYLSGIRLSQFRSFASLDIELPPEPGVLVVHGSNGLGKSSLFDGLEWALTDAIDHFRKARGVKKVGQYLCRWRDQAKDPTVIAMSFSDGGTIERSLASSAATTSVLSGTVLDITAYLKADAWRESISALSNYLLLTHFLGQSTLSRLTYRDAAERFDILKEAAQSREVEAIASAIHGRGNTVTVRAYARRVDALEKEAKRLTELLDQEEGLWSAIEGSGAVDDAQAFVLIHQLRDMIGQRRSDAIPPGQSIPDNLDSLQAQLDGARAQLRDDEAGLAQARQLIEGWRQHSAAAASTRSALAETAEQLTRLAADRVVANGERAELERAHEIANEALANVRSRRNALIALREIRNAVVRGAEQLRAAEQTLSAADRRFYAGTSALERAERRSRMVQRLNNEAEQIGREIDRWHGELERIHDWMAEDRSIAGRKVALEALEGEHLGIENRVLGAEAEAARIATVAAEQSRTLSALRETATSLSSAVATIATGMPEGTCDCPVCATHFEDASTLRARVAGAAERLDHTLLAQEEVLAETLRQQGTAKAQADQLRTTLRQIRLQRSELEAARAQGAKLLERIAHLGDDATAFDAVIDRLNKEMETLATRRRRRSYWAEQLRANAGTDLASEVARLVRVRDGEQSQRDRLARTVADRRATLDDEEGKIHAIETRFGLPELLEGRHLDAEIDASEHTHVEALQQLAEARRAADAAAERVRRIDTAEAATSARQQELAKQGEQLQAQIATATERWARLGFSTEQPTERDISGRADQLAERGHNLANGDDGLARLRSGRGVWKSQVTHRGALGLLREAVDAAPNSGRDEIRSAAQHLRNDHATAAEETRKTKSIAQAASLDLLTELDDFNAEYIQPLDALMKRINQAILTDPRVGIELQVTKKKIEQNAVKVGDLPKDLGDIDPVLIHSEGQMSALAVSQLCAASLTFPWSRWPALVLDDPMQHNDAIHTAAFADLMCNLVVEKGYQIFLSTHDQGQAEFLQRKCAARNVPCAMLSLLGIGRDGVEADFRPMLGRNRLLVNGAS